MGARAREASAKLAAMTNTALAVIDRWLARAEGRDRALLHRLRQAVLRAERRPRQPEGGFTAFAKVDLNPWEVSDALDR